VLFGMQFNLVPLLAGSGNVPTVVNSMQAAVISGCLISLLVTPMELVKSRLQVVPLEKRGGLSQIWKSQGVKGLYKGWSAVVLTRASNFSYFGAYAQVQSMLEPYSSSRVLNAVFAGGCAGISYWLVAFPFDVCKAKMMTNSSSGLLTTARTIYKYDGFVGFTRGFAPTAIRAFPANAAAFMAFEKAMQVMG